MDNPQAIVDMLQAGFIIVLLSTLVYMLVLAALSHTTPPKCS